MAKDKSGYIIAAAFIGPGTVTTASLAGANFGFHLVWALLFSIFATIVLQDMAARLGLASGQGLASAMKNMAYKPWLKNLFIVLIVSAIGIGNAAYESGNLTGAAIGLDAFISIGIALWPVFWHDRYYFTLVGQQVDRDSTGLSRLYYGWRISYHAVGSQT